VQRIHGDIDCLLDPIAANNASCVAATCSAPSAGLSVKFGCKTAGTEDILNGINQGFKDTLEARFATYPITPTVVTFGDPVQVFNSVFWTIQLTFTQELTDVEKAAGEAAIGVDVADLLDTPVANVQVSLVLVATEITAKRDVENNYVYDAYIEIAGAAQMAASLLSLVFLALFI